MSNKDNQKVNNGVYVVQYKKGIEDIATTGLFVLVFAILSPFVASGFFVVIGIIFTWEVFYAIWGTITSTFIGVAYETSNYLIKIKQEKNLKKLIAKYNKQKGKEYIVYGLE